MLRPRNIKFNRFQAIQLVFNAIALIAIALGLTAYFRGKMQLALKKSLFLARMEPNSHAHSPPPANPSVKYINTEVGNPLPGVCMPVIVTFCLNHRIPYNYTMVPSYVGHMSQTDAQQVRLVSRSRSRGDPPRRGPLGRW